MAQLNKSSTRQLHSEDSTPVHPISCETVTETACTIQIHSALYMTQLNKSSTRQLHSEDSTPVHPIYTYIYIYVDIYIYNAIVRYMSAVGLLATAQGPLMLTFAFFAFSLLMALRPLPIYTWVF